MAKISQEGKKAIQDKINELEQASSDLSKSIQSTEKDLKLYISSYKANQVKIDELKSDITGSSK